ncbi:ribonuclease E activity regulator RraA [Roseobacter sp. N2S]|uniref:ribonuclease E activity regulator RraA n=1 Tax=Roseobacter sp. N2S TaxID=2663844 RepID=UPI00285EEF4E|nr:ribonuclease E activity regulator RraA [Roseobacter sp. N2S]MDR6263087.1 regulator of ribonuclease activity A [Roseobacter sp. N2S]
MKQPDFSTADLYDDHHAALQVCELQFQSYGQHMCFSGPCVTLTTFEDHTSVLKILETSGAGRVLVVDGQGSLRVGVMGDRLAEIGAKNGWVGVVINGVIRDSTGIDALEIGVKALGATARRGWTPAPSTTDATLSIGGVTIQSGDWIYADRDCVLVAPHALESDAAKG